MLSPSFPADELSRLNALYELKILETHIEERFERITRLTKQIFRMPIVAISLIDEQRQWFKSIQGLSVCETTREISFCGHTILQDDIFIVENALEDERFWDNPLVTDTPYIRFYAGALIRTSKGKILGSLCLIDTQPRKFTLEELEPLQEMAGLIEVEIRNQDLCRAQMKLIDELDQVRLSSMIDPLTRLWNREGIERILEHQIDESESKKTSFGLAMVDIDFFKKVNDVHGHLVGDDALRCFSKHLLHLCRDTDGVGRWGGEEFILLINSTTSDDVVKFAERVRSKIENQGFEVGDGLSIQLTATIGIAFFEPGKNHTMAKLIDIADRALYKGKDLGRNRVIC